MRTTLGFDSCCTLNQLMAYYCQFCLISSKNYEHIFPLVFYVHSLNPICTGCCHVILIYGLIPPSASRNRVNHIQAKHFFWVKEKPYVLSFQTIWLITSEVSLLKIWFFRQQTWLFLMLLLSSLHSTCNFWSFFMMIFSFLIAVTNLVYAETILKYRFERLWWKIEVKYDVN